VAGDLALLGQYLLRRGSGALKELTICCVLEGALAGPFLDAIRAGALHGFEGRFDLGLGEAITTEQTQQILQAVMEAGGCPRVTSLYIDPLCDGRGAWGYLEALEAGAFPGVQDLHVPKLDDPQLECLAGVFAQGKLRNMQELRVDCDGGGEGPVSHKATARMVLKAMEEGRMPALKKLVWQGITERGTGAAKLLAAAIERGAMRDLEVLVIKVGTPGISTVTRALSTAALPRLRVLEVSQPAMTKLELHGLLTALDRGIHPRLREVFADWTDGIPGRDGMAAALKRREGLRWVRVQFGPLMDYAFGAR
jgi:hypothetical protein